MRAEKYGGRNTMARTIPTGEQSFVRLRTDNSFYIDKTKFIKEWWNNRDTVTLITRPRRFGKTLMLDTVNTFFSPQFAGQSHLFEGLAIWHDEQFRNLQGAIPVIFLSFADIKSDNFAGAMEILKTRIILLYKTFAPKETGRFSAAEEELLAAVCKGMSNETMQTSLLCLSEYLARKEASKPIILLDEYDTPLHEAWLHGYWDKLVEFMRGFFNSTFKTNPHLGRGLITGITRVGKESIFSDMNNLTVAGITRNLYADCFGFTEQEVFAAMDEYGLTDKKEAKRWYDGFIFGLAKEMYNPWSIIEYLRWKEADSYWAQTSSNALVGELILHGGFDIQEETGRLLQKKSITVTMDEHIVFSELYKTPGAIWSLLMAAGYVKPLSRKPASSQYKIALTNFEVYFILERLISNWFTVDSASTSRFSRALLADDCATMNDTLDTIAQKTFSFFDAANPEPERFYHGFVLGLIVDLKERYEIRSNRESGKGRYDVALFPKKAGDRGIVLEFKTRKEEDKDLQETCDNALKQIGEKGYTTELKAWNVAPNNIFVYGFAFEGKKVLIRGGSYASIDWENLANKKA